MSVEKNSITKTSSSGYTLLETAVVFAIASLVIVAGLVLAKAWMAQADQSVSQKRLATIQQALANYRKQFNRLPCPASFTAVTGLESTSCTGVLAAGTFSARGRNGSIDAFGTLPAPNPPFVIIGALPVRDLGLSDTYRSNVDGYQYTYAMTSSLATAPANDFAGAIDVLDNVGNSVLPRATFDGTSGTATYVVVDPGSDGKGTYLTSGAASSTACAAVAGLDQLNCSYNAANPVRFRSTPYSKRTGATWFDDLTVYSATNIANSTPNTPTCVTRYSAQTAAGAAVAPGTVTGYDYYGIDSGPYFVFGTWVVAFFVFENWFEPIDIIMPGAGFFTAAAPNATVYCPDPNYNLVTGGCTQTAGVPVLGANNSVTNPDGGGVYFGAIAFWGLLVTGYNTQTILPPLSHPTMPPTVGANARKQGWECHGSTSSGERVQAYAVCCLNNGG